MSHPATPPPSRERLLHLLAEAAELEHNLLCSYLFALFSLKEHASEDVTTAELDMIGQWRGMLLGVCIEEMTHLAQVCNLTVAIGGRPHFNRPNLPVGAGYHPASVQVELTRLDLDALNHFVFLERPEGCDVQDGDTFEPGTPYVRRPHQGSLMPSAPDYDTIGAFYDTLGDALRAYAQAHGEVTLFSGARSVQLRPEELHTDSLRVIDDLAGALAAIEDIVREGEGSPAEADSSHFTMFTTMRDQYRALVAARPAFEASRRVGRNPVMHAPVADARTHVTAPAASRVLDAANAAYGFMLRCLARCFETPWQRTESRDQLVRGCVCAMKVLSLLGRSLTTMNATAEGGDHAGVSFAMLRSLQGWMRDEDALPACVERAREIRAALATLDMPESTRRSADALLTAWLDDPALASPPWTRCVQGRVDAILADERSASG